MKSRNFTIIIITVWATIATSRWYKNAERASHFKSQYYLQTENTFKSAIEAIDNGVGWSQCLSDQAKETEKYWKCQNALDDLREWNQNQYCVRKK